MLIDSGLYTFGRTVTYEIMNVYTMKMAAVFMITTCTLSLRTDIIPRWMAFLGLVLRYSAPEHWLLLLGASGLPTVGATDQRVHPPGESQAVERPGGKFKPPRIIFDAYQFCKNSRSVVADLIAGLTTGVANIPDAMASGVLAE